LHDRTSGNIQEQGKIQGISRKVRRNLRISRQFRKNVKNNRGEKIPDKQTNRELTGNSPAVPKLLNSNGVDEEKG
jgi:hypothetical protein